MFIMLFNEKEEEERERRNTIKILKKGTLEERICVNMRSTKDEFAYTREKFSRSFSQV